MLGAAVVLVSGKVLRPSDSRPISFDLHPPAGSTFARSPMSPAPALSRDGQQLAFVARLKSKPVLWVQTIGQGPARPLSGTEDAQFPFWSPDAQFVGFTTLDGRLKKIAVSGDRAPQELCTCYASFGGTWSADDTVLFAGATGLFRVAAGGGGAEPVVWTHIDASRGEYSHRFPVLSPDGKHFVYLVRSSDEERRGLYLGSLDDQTLKKRLVPDDSNAAFGIGANGQLYLFFGRDSSLIAQPLDVPRGALFGSGVVMGRPVRVAAAGRLAAFAVGGRTLVYRLSSIAPNRLVWVDRSGTRGATVGTAGAEYAFPALAPDGARLAVARSDANTGIRNIWLIDLQRAKEEQLTDDPLDAHFPQWTANGRIVFGSPVEARWDIFWRWGDGTRGDRALFHPPPGSNTGVTGRDGWVRDVTRDERFLLYGANNALWVQRLDEASEPSRLLEADHARVSPDGRWLAYTSVERGEQEIYVTTFPTATRRWRISVDGGRDPQWRSNGSQLYDVANGRDLMAADVSEAIHRGNFDKVVPQPLFRASFDGFSLDFGSAYSPARDGRRFLVVEEVEGHEPVLNVRLNWVPGGV